MNVGTVSGTGGMVTTPHRLASEAGLEVLRDGGSAVEAVVAAAAAIAVLYPHMNGIGGDGFWLMAEPGNPPVGIDACGPSAAAAMPDFYSMRGFDAIPARGPLAALTVPGTVAGWQAALAALPNRRPMPLDRLLAPAVLHAREGMTVTRGQATLTAAKYDELAMQPGFSETFLVNGAPPAEGKRQRNPHLADTLDHLGRTGIRDFYHGDVAETLARDLSAAGSPLCASDLAMYAPRRVEPLDISLSVGRVYNLPPPTQGLASLLILGLFDRLGVTDPDGFRHLHGLVEATKAAFLVRDGIVTDSDHMAVSPRRFLDTSWLDATARTLPTDHATPWPRSAAPGDTVWLGAVDADGRAVSFIQSLYWEFGSGVVSPRTGIVMQNRGTSFSLRDHSLNRLEPGRRPFHTLNPALARLDDGRTMVYGTMGGEGQPQTQAAVFTRYAMFNQPLQAAISAPRWLLGRTWGESTTSLKLESRIPEDLVARLRRAGHDVETLTPFSDAMGHAGAIVRHTDGRLDGASDPRSDGAALAL